MTESVTPASEVREFDKNMRPKVGVGVMIVNEFDEVLLSRRFDK